MGTWNTILILIDQNTGCETAVAKAVNMLKHYCLCAYA